MIDCGEGYDKVVVFNPANCGYHRGPVIAMRAASAGAQLQLRHTPPSLAWSTRASGLGICCAEPLVSSALSP
ncbi:MAG TPA: hypothetical protein VH500_19440 [Nitrososphaeraceae archaeon]